MLVSPVAEDNKRLCHSLKATLPYRICCWLGGYSSHHPSIVSRVSSRRCTSGETTHSLDSFAPWLAAFIALMNSTRLLHALEARNFGISLTVLNNRFWHDEPFVLSQIHHCISKRPPLKVYCNRMIALNKTNSGACPPPPVSHTLSEPLTTGRLVTPQ